MEHPEKALFDEVRGLRSTLEESRERITKVEKEYQDKVINLEKRCQIDERCSQKIIQWKQSCKNRVTLYLNEKEYSFYRTTFKENIYILNSSFLPENESSELMNCSKNYFKGFLEIIRTGHRAFTTESKKRNFNDVLEKSLKGEANFVTFIKSVFDAESVLNIAKDFGLNYIYIGKGSDADLLDSFSVQTPYSISNNQHVETDVKNLAKKDNKKGLFKNYNGEIVINLTETIRTNRIFIKPFTSDYSNFSPTNGASYETINVSLDGVKYDYVLTLPSTYGNGTNNNISELSFPDLFSFKYIKFKSNSSCLFSLSYLSFRPTK